ncbi:D-alanyl-D-alanine carboxypeptidase [Clostridium lacusfryxellense]|nr:D-alanyl-D-alanine carboxypeptidase [Clostridium lacusfryxellense]
MTTYASAATSNLPVIYGQAAITVDVATGEIIYAKNVDKKMYPASTTKLMTALLLAQNREKTDAIKYTLSAKSQEPGSLNTDFHPIGLDETMLGADVMDALLLYSANDAAYMIADNVSGDSTSFMKLMNDKAAELNMSGTHFITPNGLHRDDHYSTPYDMSILARASFLNSWVKESMSKKENTISTSKGTTFKLENSNKLLGIDGCIGGKTGFTTPAGRCLVAFFMRDGREAMGVVLGSEKDALDTYVFNDMKEIIDYSYSQQKTVLHRSNDIIKTETVKYKPLGFLGLEKTISVPLVAKEEVSYYNNEANKKDLKENIKLTSVVSSTLKGNESIGTLTLTEKGKVKTYKLYSQASKGNLLKNSILMYITTAGIIILFLIVIAVIIRTINLNKRKKRR